MDRNLFLVHNGAYCSVYRTPVVEMGEVRYTNEAVKTPLPGSTPAVREAFKNMLDYLSNIRITHDFIAPFYVRGQSVLYTGPGGPQPSLTLARPWFEFNVLQYAQKNTISLEVKLKLVLQTAQAIEHLHSHSIVHGHIHPGNIFVMAEKQGERQVERAIVTDVGVYLAARHFLLHPQVLPLDRGRPPNPSPIYQAGEWLHPAVTPDKPSDVYAFASTVYAIFTGVLPFYGDFTYITATSHLNIIKPPDCIIGENLWLLLQDCWKSDPARRPEITEVLVRLDDIATYG